MSSQSSPRRRQYRLRPSLLTDDPDFNTWMHDVAEHVERLAGLDVEDLADFDYRACFEAGEDARDVARRVLMSEGFMERQEREE